MTSIFFFKFKIYFMTVSGALVESAFSCWVKCSLNGKQIQLAYSVIQFVYILVDLLATNAIKN